MENCGRLLNFRFEGKIIELDFANKLNMTS